MHSSGKFLEEAPGRGEVGYRHSGRLSTHGGGLVAMGLPTGLESQSVSQDEPKTPGLLERETVRSVQSLQSHYPSPSLQSEVIAISTETHAQDLQDPLQGPGCS